MLEYLLYFVDIQFNLICGMYGYDIIRTNVRIIS